MNSSPLRPWWLRKRVLLPLALVTGVAAAAVLAFWRSDRSTIVVYNETGRPLPPLLIRACGQERSCPVLSERESVRFKLRPEGEETAVRLELAADPTWKWEGDPITPRGGRRLTIHLWPGGQVEAYAEISWWRKRFE